MTIHVSLGQKTINLGINIKNGISTNMAEWSMSKDNFYVIINNRDGEEFKAKMAFFTFDDKGVKTQIIDFKKLPQVTIGHGINYFTSSELLPSFSFDAPVLINSDVTFRVELIPLKQKDFDFAALSDIKLKHSKSGLKSLEEPKSDYVIAWDSELSTGVAYNLALQGKGIQNGIIISNVNMKINESYFVNVSNNIPTETYYEVSDDNTAYAQNPKYILTEELYSTIDIIDPKLLEIIDNKKAISKINIVIHYIDRLKENSGIQENLILSSSVQEILILENKKTDYVIKANDIEGINTRILDLYERLASLKLNIKPSNSNQANLVVMNEFKDILGQLIRCKIAVEGHSFATN